MLLLQRLVLNCLASRVYRRWAAEHRLCCYHQHDQLQDIRAKFQYHPTLGSFQALYDFVSLDSIILKSIKQVIVPAYARHALPYPGVVIVHQPCRIKKRTTFSPPQLRLLHPWRNGIFHPSMTPKLSNFMARPRPNRTGSSLN